MANRVKLTHRGIRCDSRSFQHFFENDVTFLSVGATKFALNG
ncbi:hypothetical protein RRSWK_05092 [Rhodopirellula sp. SWK7]|nr:hypothetical protein RRSWK_05092 [Rhodopirellula sp. SWK7]